MGTWLTYISIILLHFPVIILYLSILELINDVTRQERLRNKIIARLSKEGSSAEEPINIDLTDYSRYIPSDNSYFVCIMLISK